MRVVRPAGGRRPPHDTPVRSRLSEVDDVDLVAEARRRLSEVDDAEHITANRRIADGLVGVTSDEAARRIAEAGLRFRLFDFDLDASATDGVFFGLTDDLRVNRVTLYVKEGRVTRTEVG